MLACGRRWGKTRLGVVMAVRTAILGGLVWWVAPTYPQSAIAWRLTLRLVAKLPGVVPHKTEKWVEFPGGGSVWFKSAERSENLRGEGLSLLIMDEAAYIAEEVWTEVLRPALTDRRGWAVFVSTPAEERGWYRKAWERGQPDSSTYDPAWRSWRFPTTSNPFIDSEEVAEARLTITEAAYRREFLAEFVSGEGAMVKGSDLTVIQPPADLVVMLGVDLAISERTLADWTAIVALGKAPATIGTGKEEQPHPYAGHTWTLWAKRGRWSFKVTQDQVVAAAAKWSPRRILIESVAYQAAAVQELLRTTALPVKAAQADRDKVVRFQPVAARYEHKLHHHAPGLAEWYEDEVLAFPIGEHDDGVDATAYAFRALMEGPRVEAMVA